MEFVYNFAAGPTSLPKEVMADIIKELSRIDGNSAMELSPTQPRFDEIYKETEALVRDYLQVPDNYRVFFMHGTRANQYAAIPLNLLGEGGKADYIISGQSSMRASNEAKKYCDVAVAASSAGASFSFVPATTKASFRSDASYVHICYSNAYHGTQFPYIPDTGDIPLIADMTPCLGLENIDISSFGMVYAGTQDNLGISGMTIVIIREDLIKEPSPMTPAVLNYSSIDNLMLSRNVPAIWNVYVTGLMIKYLKSQGGLAEMARRAAARAAILYDYLDHQNYYIVPVDKGSRSNCSVVFRTADPKLDKQFITEAAQAGLKNLRGHRNMGGMRACMFNAMPHQGAEQLVHFMKQFATNNPIVES